MFSINHAYNRLFFLLAIAVKVLTECNRIITGFFDASLIDISIIVTMKKIIDNFVNLLQLFCRLDAPILSNLLSNSPTFFHINPLNQNSMCMHATI